MPEADGPLLTLAWGLRSLGPPSLSVLIARLEETEDYEDFLALVREFLPEREREILRQPTPAGQMATFADRFQDRYFPLGDRFRKGYTEGYADLTRGIPVVALGISPEDYHDLDLRPGLLLMTYLVEVPSWIEAGARVPLGEACAEHVPTDLLCRAPERGLSRSVTRSLLRDTSYEGLAHWADMLEWDTGNYFLDISSEELWEELPPWKREVVEALTREWQQAEVIQKSVLDLAQWLEEDPPARFGELLDFLERGMNGQT